MQVPLRQVLLAACLAGAFLLIIAPVPARADPYGVSLEGAAARIEQRLRARVGVAVLDPVGGRDWQYRGDERFPLTSTFKPLACAALLARVDAGDDTLQRAVAVRRDDLVTYSPVTADFVGTDITLGAACEATITVSDNTAGNLVLSAIGGPRGLTTFLRQLGDAHSRLDRVEPLLNEATPGDPRDTTTPGAMVRTLAALLGGTVLSPSSARRLEGWMVADRVADALFRARLPAGWGIGDKTGAGGHGSRALVAVLRPPGGSVAFAAVYLTETDADFATRNAAIAEIGATIFDLLSTQ